MKKVSNKQYPVWFKAYLSVISFFRKSFIKDKYIIFFILSAVLVNVIIWIYLRLSLSLDPFNIVLHYRVYEGATIINTSEHAFYLPSIGVFIFLVNLILSIYFHGKDKFISYLSLTISLIAQLILLSTSISLVLANK